MATYTDDELVNLTKGWELTGNAAHPSEVSGFYVTQQSDHDGFGDASKFADFWTSGANCGKNAAVSCINLVSYNMTHFAGSPSPVPSKGTNGWWTVGERFQWPSDIKARFEEVWQAYLERFGEWPGGEKPAGQGQTPPGAVKTAGGGFGVVTLLLGLAGAAWYAVKGKFA